MPKAHHPYLTATLGEAALRLPPELAQPLEAAFAAANEAPAPINLPGCLQRIRAGDAADGQPWTGPASTPGQAVAAARRDRAAVGLVSLLSCITPQSACAWTGKRRTISAMARAKG